MGTVRFELRKDKINQENKAPIRVIYQISGQRSFFPTGQTIYPANWDEGIQQAVFIKKGLLMDQDIKKINNKLADFTRDIKKIEARFEANGVSYSITMIIDALKKSRAPVTKTDPPSNQVFDFIEKYIQDNASSREPGSMSVYKSLKNHLKNFQVQKKKKVTFDSIDYSFFLDFQNFLIHTKSKGAPNGLGNVTIAKQLSTLKTFLNYARMHGIEVSSKYKDFTIKKESLEVIALTNDEFEALYNFDLSKNTRLAQVRDVFCFSCATGLRYSDLAQLKREHIKKDEIRITVTKTKQQLSIPLNPFSHAILAKYSEMMKPLPVISNQKMNDYIKELCKKAEIADPVQIVRFRGNKREETLYPKFELISVHTGRKTFCTLSLEKGMSAEEVMQISGHKDYSSFSRYVKITEKRTKVVMGKAWGEVPRANLKAV